MECPNNSVVLEHISDTAFCKIVMLFSLEFTISDTISPFKMVKDLIYQIPVW